ncbi:MAG: hypothetical protein M1540_03820 [Candidatus Bathyarchaeota archaeon]|nr:hypothetical protein [Candidatus Bathyarchaeota archaeon]
MTQHTFRDKAINDGLISALAVGGFLIILGVAFGLTPGVPQKIGEFFGDLTGVAYPVINGDMVLPAPAHPAQHIEVYSAVFNFAVGIAVLEVVILALRLLLHSSIKKIAETVGNMVFWVGAVVVVSVFLQAGTLTGWFTFWATLIILAGLSLITQFVIRIVAYRTKR